MELTRHARIRQQQRSIPPMIIELLIGYGACEKAGDGTSKHYFDKRSKRRLDAYAGKLSSLLIEHLNCYVVVCPEGRVITAGHRTERIKH
ncbi:hypothetical protein SAMN05216386_1688 [Nitrosospira briensis]|uniref:DUF4258 domain-containing protein n=1 Tax=Nitrosospira briensis TaxID=35799 RepID=A0A1I5BIJ1_9PROT|nr:hypothetical protein [Nitrosospira briensis]SFN74564.1 hypothetical protein SAMN05216386_1688 [Nitrosospira briensis]